MLLVCPSGTDYRVFIDGSGDVNAVANPIVDGNGDPVTQEGVPEYQLPGESVRPDGGENADRDAATGASSLEIGTAIDRLSGDRAQRHGDGGSAASLDRRAATAAPDSSQRDKPLPSDGTPTPPPLPPTWRDRLGGHVRAAWDEVWDRILPAIGPEEGAARGGLRFLSAIGLALKARWFLKPSSRVLRRALEESGFAPRIGDEAHHIIAGEKDLAKPAREILERFGIGINEGANGVFLAKRVHQHLHSTAYYQEVNRLLEDASSRADVMRILSEIRQRLLAGQFP